MKAALHGNFVTGCIMDKACIGSISVYGLALLDLVTVVHTRCTYGSIG